MPSRALFEFRKNLTDVTRVLSLHARESGADRGRRGLGHLTRGGLLLLCAAWERYSETLVLASAEVVTRRTNRAAQLPAGLQTVIRNHANSNQTPWTAAQVGTPAWTRIYLHAVRQQISSLNSPKSIRLKPIYARFLHIGDITVAWTQGDQVIDDFVTLRGAVAHRGREGPYVLIRDLKNYKEVVRRYAVETDNFLSDHLQRWLGGRRPWNRSR